jgi:hypothetical protein
MALPLYWLPRGAPGPLALASPDVVVVPVPPTDVRTCTRHRSYWLASCQTCRAARRLTLTGPVHAPTVRR